MEIIEDNLHPKVLKNRLFINAIDHLIEQKVVEDQKGVSARTGLTEATLSNIRNDKKIVSDKTIRKFLENFPGIFNPEYFRCNSEHMLADEPVQASEPAPEYVELPRWADSIIQLVTEQVKTIEDLRREVAALHQEISNLKRT